ERFDAGDVRGIEDAVRGPSARARARFDLPAGVGTLTVAITLPDDASVLELRISSDRAPLQSVRYIDPAQGALVLGGEVKYLADRSHLYMGEIHPDGHVRRAPLEATKPALIWSETSNQGVLLSMFDYAPSPAWLTFQRRPGRDDIALGFELDATLG